MGLCLSLSPAGGNSTTHTITGGRPPEHVPMQPVTLRVVDEATRPIPDVLVTVDGLHSGLTKKEIGHGAWKTWRDGPAPSVSTDTDGLATLAAPFFWNEKVPVLGVSFFLKHPDYGTHRELNYPATGVVHDIILKSGNTLVVGAWYGSRNQQVSDFESHISRAETGAVFMSSPIHADQWSSLGADKVCRAFPNGKAIIYLKARLPDGQIAFSDLHTFEFAGGGEQRRIDLELRPAVTLHGRLCDNVPRPVSNGKVAVNMIPPRDSETSGPPIALIRGFTADVRPDGSFTLENLPDGPGEIIGACDDWIAAENTPPIPKMHQPAFISRDRSFASSRHDGHNQRFEVNGDPDRDALILQMNRGGTLRVTVSDPDGEPIAGAKLALSPNVRWPNSATIYLDAERWCAVSDAQGIAEVRGLHEGQHGYVVYSDDYVMPQLPGDNQSRSHRMRLAHLISGEIVETSVTLVSRTDEVLGENL